MEASRDDEGAKAIAILILGAILLYCLIYLITIIGVLLVIGATGASLFYGFKLGHQIAVESEVWENRRIAKHRKLEATRQTEKEYFKAQQQEWMQVHVDNYYDDKQRDLYQKDKNRFDDALNNIKKIKDALK